MAEIGDQPVRNVHHRRCRADERLAQAKPRLRQPVAVDQERPLPPRRCRQARPRPPSSAQRRIAERARDVDAVSRPARRAAARRVPAATRPIAATESVAGPGVATESPPRSPMPKVALIGGKPGGEFCEPGLVARWRQRRHQQIADRRRALGGEIGEIDAQQLLRRPAPADRRAGNGRPRRWRRS